MLCLSVNGIMFSLLPEKKTIWCMDLVTKVCDVAILQYCAASSETASTCSLQFAMDLLWKVAEHLEKSKNIHFKDIANKSKSQSPSRCA